MARSGGFVLPAKISACRTVFGTRMGRGCKQSEKEKRGRGRIEKCIRHLVSRVGVE